MHDILTRYDELKIEQKLKEILYIQNAVHGTIEWGMNYIVFSPSKRIRPLLVLEANQAFCKPDNDAYILAACIELIHTYSLVHDDLPCMDDDDLRRGLPTLHKVKNEAYAVLVGDALLTRSFGILSEYSKINLIPQILKLFNLKAGFSGMISGQFLDMEAEGKNQDIESIDIINKNKTSAMIELSLLCGALNGGANSENLANIEKLGLMLGRIFQLKDDILDISGDTQILGKKTGSDHKNKKSSIPLMLGIEQSLAILDKYKNETEQLIKKLPANQENFFSILDFLLKRQK